MEKEVEIIKAHGLRKTPVRVDILRYFSSKGYALSQPEIEDHFKKDFDRVTIYRTLHTYMECGILHKVPSEDGLTRYALCQHEHVHSEPHAHEHIHFSCTDCGKTTCIDSEPVPQVHLPKGFKAEETSLFVKGTCDKCAG
ncbi:MAG: Fur family transcriptional regulator [Flavobacteriales bacterium]